MNRKIDDDEEGEGDEKILKNEFAITTRATQTKTFALRVCNYNIEYIFLYLSFK